MVRGKQEVGSPRRTLMPEKGSLDFLSQGPPMCPVPSLKPALPLQVGIQSTGSEQWKGKLGDLTGCLTSLRCS